jgi:voltage-gated sodium channel
MRYYLILCNIAEKIVLNSYFNSYIFFCIILAGILVGAQTYPALETFVVFVYCNHIILASFILEVVLKLMSEGTDIHRYFTGEEYHWNIFDFLIVLFSLPIINTGGQVAFLRLIRLMRLGKIFKKVPQLRMIINGLFGGMKSIAYIVILLFLVFYLFAITGILAFQRNDPWHFRSVSISLTTLFQIATLTVRYSMI